MDTITQGLLGAAVAEAGFSERLGRRAVWFGAACGLMPDADVVMRVAGEWASLVHHRGVTHSFIALPIVAPLIGALACRVLGGGRDRVAWMHLTFWALVTHPMLDLFTTYGTQIFSPLSDSRWALDGVAIVDPIYTVPLGWAVFKRHVRGARIALAWGAAYLLFGAALSAHVRSEARAQLEAEGFRPVAVRALVPILFPMLRRVVARDAAGEMRVGAWSWKGPMEFVAVERDDDPAVDVALESEEGAIFSWFADGYVAARIERGADATTVRLFDKRYTSFSDPQGSLFGAEITVKDGRVVAATRMRRALDFGAEWSAQAELAY